MQLSKQMAMRPVSGDLRSRSAGPTNSRLRPQVRKDESAKVPDPKIKYQQLLFYAKKLKPMAAALHTEENKVQGCVSQVWVHPRVDDGKIYWEADSDSALTKGLAALLVQGLSGSTADDIVAIPPDFIDRLGLQQSLTPSRNNGFLNMFRLMQRKSLELVQQQEHSPKEAATMPKPVPADSKAEQPVHTFTDLKAQENQEDAQAQQLAAKAAEEQSQSATAPSGPAGPLGPQSAAAPAAAPVAPAADGAASMQASPDTSQSPIQALQASLQEAFAPTALQVQHQQHQTSQNGNTVSQTELQIHIISEKFKDQPESKRRSMIEEVIKSHFTEGSGTWSLTAQAPSEQSS